MPSSSHLKIFQIFSKSQSWLVQIYSHVYVRCIAYGECLYHYSQEEPSRSVWGRNYFLPASTPLSLRYVCSNTPPGHSPRTHTRKPPQGYRAHRTRSEAACGLQTRTNSEEGHAGSPGCRNTAPENGAAHGAPLKPPTAAAGRRPSLVRPRQPPERSPPAAGQTPTPRSPGAGPGPRIGQAPPAAFSLAPRPAAEPRTSAPPAAAAALHPDAHGRGRAQRPARWRRPRLCPRGRRAGRGLPWPRQGRGAQPAASGGRAAPALRGAGPGAGGAHPAWAAARPGPARPCGCTAVP